MYAGVNFRTLINFKLVDKLLVLTDRFSRLLYPESDVPGREMAE